MSLSYVSVSKSTIGSIHTRHPHGATFLNHVFFARAPNS